ncbi:DNA polymerase IV [Pseudohongiella nitratireducens]|nr:DNA polymerase IV [Pseudohongiella nitratireducens]MDF1622163.1 DNA polymerase IV [Pseudohongiella nitratireducens]|tara:strand:+ start:3846 stop:4952 length:1107 start_codon:yes stop_codon:yes gene_type:complete
MGAVPENNDEPQRKIIHCDCDCFYAAIEMRDDPALRGRPLAVGGASERRGVVATCNYEARKFGIHSAMPTSTALRRCPPLIVVPPRMDVYREVSAKVHEIFSEYTALIEPLSLDEAYLDVSQATACQGSATLMAREIRERVRAELGITISAGIAPNKFIAKIASDWEKPDGQFVVLPHEVDAFVSELPVKKLFGVGKVMAARLHEMGVEKCGQLRGYTEAELVSRFGSFGQRLYQLCRGIDQREVKVERQRKSLSVENTFPVDLPNLPACQFELEVLFEQMVKRWQKLKSKYRVQGCFVKLKFDNFVTTTAEQTAESPDRMNYTPLMETAWQRHRRPVRLIGVGVRLSPISSTADSEYLQSQLDLPLS